MAEGGGSPPRPDPRRRNVPSEEDDDDDFVSSSVTRDHYKKLRNEYIQCKHVIANATALLICITTSIFFSSVLEDSFLYMMSLVALLLVVVSFVLEVIIKTDFIKCPLTNTFFMMVWILDLGCGLISLVMCVVCLILAYDEYNELMKQEYSIFFAISIFIIASCHFYMWYNNMVIYLNPSKLESGLQRDRRRTMEYRIFRRNRNAYRNHRFYRNFGTFSPLSEIFEEVIPDSAHQSIDNSTESDKETLIQVKVIEPTENFQQNGRWIWCPSGSAGQTSARELRAESNQSILIPESDVSDDSDNNVVSPTVSGDRNPNVRIDVDDSDSGDDGFKEHVCDVSCHY